RSSACPAVPPVRCQASAGSQPSYSPFQPWGAIRPTCIIASIVAYVVMVGRTAEPCVAGALRLPSSIDDDLRPAGAAGRRRRPLGISAAALAPFGTAVPHDRHDRGRALR